MGTIYCDKNCDGRNVPAFVPGPSVLLIGCEALVELDGDFHVNLALWLIGEYTSCWSPTTTKDGEKV